MRDVEAFTTRLSKLDGAGDTGERLMEIVRQRIAQTDVHDDDNGANGDGDGDDRCKPIGDAPKETENDQVITNGGDAAGGGGRGGGGAAGRAEYQKDGEESKQG